MKYKWIEYDNYWELQAPQGDQIWLDGRIGRVTTSVSAGMADESRFKTAEKQGKIIAGVEEENFTEEELERMNHGTVSEEPTRLWYCQHSGYKIEERGLIVPKWDLEIGASIDGDIVDSGPDGGIIEIKCPVRMYYPLEQYMDQLQTGWVPPKGYYKHIWRSHFHQVQHAMAVMGKKWCIYIVNSVVDGKVFTQKIHFDPDHWNKYYPIMKANYNKYVKVYLDGKYPLLPHN